MNTKTDGTTAPERAEAAPPKRVSSLPPPVLGRGALIALGSLFGTAWIGAALAPYLAVEHPLILIALTPWPRHLILVAPHTPMLPLVAVATARGLVACIITYEVGRMYGPQGMQMFEKRSAKVGRFLRFFERLFLRAAAPLLILSPGPLTSSLSGMTGSSRLFTWSLSAAGLCLWACVNYKLGDWLSPYTAPILEFIRRYLLETTLACTALVLAYQWIARRRRLRREGWR